MFVQVCVNAVTQLVSSYACLPCRHPLFQHAVSQTAAAQSCNLNTFHFLRNVCRSLPLRCRITVTEGELVLFECVMFLSMFKVTKHQVQTKTVCCFTLFANEPLCFMMRGSVCLCTSPRILEAIFLRCSHNLTQDECRQRVFMQTHRYVS